MPGVGEGEEIAAAATERDITWDEEEDDQGYDQNDCHVTTL